MAKMTTSRSSAPTTTASAVSKASMSRNRGWLAASLRPSPPPATTNGAPCSAGARPATRSARQPPSRPRTPPGGTPSRGTPAPRAPPPPAPRRGGPPLRAPLHPPTGPPATAREEDQHADPHRALGEDEYPIRRQHAQQRPV